MLSYCGLICDSCPVHLATLETDESVKLSMRKSIAQLCNEKYNMNLGPENITDCDGCKSGTGRLFSGCMDCGIRKCVEAKSIENCAYCEDYACKELEKMFNDDPEAKERLDKIRAGLQFN